MATTTVPSSPSSKTNRIGLEMAQYKGNKSTLCAGCGHNAISERIIEACYEMGVRTPSRRQAIGHWLFVQESCLLPE